MTNWNKFEAWLEQVDAVFVRKSGLDRDSWPDQDYAGMFEDGLTPDEAFDEFVENEGYSGMFNV